MIGARALDRQTPDHEFPSSEATRHGARVDSPVVEVHEAQKNGRERLFPDLSENELTDRILERLL